MSWTRVIAPGGVARLVGILLLSSTTQAALVRDTGPIVDKGKEATTATAGAPIVAPPPWPTFQPASAFPLTIDLKPLLSAPPLPQHSAPIVYMAPFGEVGKTWTTNSVNLRGILRMQLRATPRDKLMLNFLSNHDTWLPFEHENKTNYTEALIQPHNVYQREAQLMGADYLMLGDVTDVSSSTRLELTLEDLNSSRTQTVECDTALGLQPCIAEAVDACTTFFRISKDDAQAAGMYSGLPREETWSALTQGAAFTAAGYGQLLASDPDCMFLIDYGQETMGKQLLPFVENALRSHPEDARLLFSKASLLHLKGMAPISLGFLSELTRRCPESLIYLALAPEYLSAAYLTTEQSHMEPEPYKAYLDLMHALLEKHPRLWHLRLDCARIEQGLGAYCRGSGTSEKVAEQGWELHFKYARMMLKEADLAASVRTDVPAIYTCIFDAHFDLQDYDYGTQKGLIDEVHKLDPSNTELERRTAYSHSAGWDEPGATIPIFKAALRVHQGDDYAMMNLAISMAEMLCRDRGFKYVSDANAYCTTYPLMQLFVSTFEPLIIEKHWSCYYPRATDTLYKYYVSTGQRAKMDALADAGTCPLFTGQVADDAQLHGNLERALKLAWLADSKEGEPAKMYNRYFIVDTLWKWKHYDEAIKEAERGKREYNDSSFFYYQWAAIENDRGDRLNEALRSALAAQKLAPYSSEVNALVDTLRKKVAQVQVNAPVR